MQQEGARTIERKKKIQQERKREHNGRKRERYRRERKSEYGGDDGLPADPCKSCVL